jgi:hypothetical protein
MQVPEKAVECWIELCAGFRSRCGRGERYDDTEAPRFEKAPRNGLFCYNSCYYFRSIWSLARLLNRTAHPKEVRWSIETGGIRIRRGRRTQGRHRSRSGVLHDWHYQHRRKLQPPRLTVKLQVRRRPPWTAHCRRQSIARTPLQFATNQHSPQRVAVLILLRTLPVRQLAGLPVKSERRSLGMGATQREGVRGGSLPHFILRHRPIFDVSDFPMLLGFRFSTDRTIDSISVSFYHFLWDF